MLKKYDCPILFYWNYCIPLFTEFTILMNIFLCSAPMPFTWHGQFSTSTTRWWWCWNTFRYHRISTMRTLVMRMSLVLILDLTSQRALSQTPPPSCISILYLLLIPLPLYIHATTIPSDQILFTQYRKVMVYSRSAKWGTGWILRVFSSLDRYCAKNGDHAIYMDSFSSHSDETVRCV